MGNLAYGLDESLPRLERMMPPAWHLHSITAEPGIGFAVVLREAGPRPWQHRRIEGCGPTMSHAIDDAADRLGGLLVDGGANDALVSRRDAPLNYDCGRSTEVIGHPPAMGQDEVKLEASDMAALLGGTCQAP